MNFIWGKRSYIEERSGIACLVAGVWKLRQIRKKMDKGRCLLCLGADSAKYVVEMFRM
jgi:hypothetical protein